MIRSAALVPVVSCVPGRTEGRRFTDSNKVTWDAVAAIIAAFVGLLALVVGGYTAYVQHQGVQTEIKGVRAQVWPYPEIGESGTGPGGAGNDTGAG